MATFSLNGQQVTAPDGMNLIQAAELNGVSFSKGCFVGQENTARMNWRQKVNRRLFVALGGGGERSRVEYPEANMSVVHARVDAIPANAIIPDWLKPALEAAPAE